MRQLPRTTGMVVVIALVIAPAACTGSTDEPAKGDPSDQPGPSATIVPDVERVVAQEGSALFAGPDDSRLDVTAVASDGDVVVATAIRTSADREDVRTELLHSSDSEEWGSAELPASVAEGGSLDDVTWTGDGFVAVGNTVGDGAPVAVLWNGDESGELIELPFPEVGGDGDPFGVQAVATVDERLYAVGTAIEGSADAPEDAVARLALVVSEDAGRAWEHVELPEPMRVLDSGPALMEHLAGGMRAADVGLAVHDAALLLSSSVTGADAGATTLWRSGEAGQEWTALGTTAELFDGETLSLMHSHEGSLLAFTSADGDASAWRDDGDTFTRVDTPPHVFGGGGAQLVQDAVTLDDGTLVAAGATEGEARRGQRPRDLELWVTPDLDRWERALTHPELGGEGRQRAAGIVVQAGQAVVVGTHQRPPSDEEGDAFEESDEPSNALEWRINQHGAVWRVSAVKEEQADVGIDVTPIEVTGFDGDVTVNDVTALDGVLVAVGSATTEDDDHTAAVWTSADGLAWERVNSPALDEPVGQELNAVVASDDGLVAVGRSATGDDTSYLGVWTSPDGTEWTGAQLTGEQFEDAEGFDVSETADGLIAVGTASPDGRDYRDVGIWTSTDAGQSWSPAETTGEPFQARDVEALTAVTATSDGTIVAGGHTGDATSTDNGFSYIVEPYVISSGDGDEWTVEPAPFEGYQYGSVEELAADDDGLVVLGRAGEPDGLGNGAINGMPPIAGQSAEGWEVPDERFRPVPSIDREVDTPAGRVVLGSWFHAAGGSDALIGVRSGLDFDSAPNLLAEGDQDVVGGAVLGDRLIALGTEETDEASTIIGWEVTW